MSAKTKKFDHLITEQFQAETAFLAEYKNGLYSFDKPYVKLNPYLIAPLTALVMFRTAAPTSVKVTVKGKEKAGDVSFDFASATEHVVPVYGLYAGCDNQIELQLSTGEMQALTIRTEPAPAKVKSPTKIETTPQYFQDNMMFVSPTSPAMGRRLRL